MHFFMYPNMHTKLSCCRTHAWWYIRKIYFLQKFLRISLGGLFNFFSLTDTVTEPKTTDKVQIIYLVAAPHGITLSSNVAMVWDMTGLFLVLLIYSKMIKVILYCKD